MRSALWSLEKFGDIITYQECTPKEALTASRQGSVCNSNSEWVKAIACCRRSIKSYESLRKQQAKVNVRDEVSCHACGIAMCYDKLPR